MFGVSFSILTLVMGLCILYLLLSLVYTQNFISSYYNNNNSY